jgi:FemAB-related protein (PEP-CTERM system-associated)
VHPSPAAPVSGAASVRPFAVADAARWDDYVARSPGSHFGQTVSWKAAQERAYGVRARWWLAERDGAVAGVLPLFEARGLGGRRRLFSAPGGMLADDAATAAALLEPAREALRAEGHEWIELRDQRARWEGLETIEENVTMELELPGDPATLWKAFGPKLRNQVRKGEKSAFGVCWGHEHVGDFHRVVLESMRDLGTPMLGVDYYRSVLAAFGERANVLVLKDGRQPVAGMLVIEHARTMADPWAASPRRFLARCPNQVLYWAAIRRGIERGFTRFDFGRSQWHSGTFRFKEQWLAKPVPVHYQYVLGTAKQAPTLEDQKHSLALAVRIWQRLPIPLAGLLGRGVKRLFPEAL